MCPEPRWIGYPAPRSPADSFAMAGPIRHCLLRAFRVGEGMGGVGGVGGQGRAGEGGGGQGRGGEGRGGEGRGGRDDCYKYSNGTTIFK